MSIVRMHPARAGFGEVRCDVWRRFETPVASGAEMLTIVSHVAGTSVSLSVSICPMQSVDLQLPTSVGSASRLASIVGAGVEVAELQAARRKTDNGEA
jgi:hypothetical protein